MDTTFQQTVERYGAVLYRLAFSYCGNRPDAEDAVQEAFVKYLRCTKSFDSEEHLLNWLMLVTANQCRDLLRSPWRRRRREVDTLPELAAPEVNTDEMLAVRQAIEALPSGYRGVVYLYYYEDYPVSRIAAALGLSETAVRSRLFRARKQLKELLGGASA